MMKKLLFVGMLLAALTACKSGSKQEAAEIKDLPRVETAAPVASAMENYFKAVEEAKQDLHSIMVVQHGNVIYQRWLSEGEQNKPHVLNSVSKTFTSAAVGLAISEGKLKLTDKLVSFFPDKLPAEQSDNLKAITIRDLLTMNCGHDTDPTRIVRDAEDGDWIKAFLAYPVEHQPGTFYCYNSLGTYMLSAIVQQVTGEKVVDYLTPRLFEPLNIEKPEWQESPQGINTGGWGLFLKTEDLARMGLCLLGGGKFAGKQVIPAGWVAEMSAKQVTCVNAGMNERQLQEIQSNPEHPAYAAYQPENNDWIQGYGYQMWRCRHGAFRADGANGQYIIVIPDKDAVVVTTAHIRNMQQELNLIWNHILPAL
jgi:CubicO group peptidase (beta-lactamase class C family)